MSAGEKPRIVVIRRRGGGGHGGHHGGAWKVAYADFATAMMAFFLLMWLLNATTEDQRKGLADYFDPSVPISPVSAGGAGMLWGEDLFVDRPLAGSVPKGVRPRRAGIEAGPELGEDAASPDRPRSSGPAGSDASSSADDGMIPHPAESGLAETIDSMADEHLTVRIEPDGLVIEIADLAEEPLFAAGSSEPTPVLRELVAIVTEAIADTLNPIAILGHTDSTPFAGTGYSNWELSADRANAARRLMIEFGLPEARFSRVIGKAATAPVDDDPRAPRNRRIAIKLLKMPQR